MFARIEGGVVVELWDVAELPPLHPELAAKYIEIQPDDAAVGDLYEDGIFTTPPAPVEPVREPVDDLSALVETLAAKGMLTQAERDAIKR